MLNNRLRNAHYYFDLRALKCVLVSADSLKCEHHQIKIGISEQEIVIQSILLKLVADDIPLLADVFPGVKCSPVDLDKLINEIINKKCFLDGEIWLEKVLH